MLPESPATSALETARSQVRAPAPLPPAGPAGWHAGPPDFVGVGTIRSGTTWWHYLIGCHPDVSRPPSRPKEVHYFDQFGDSRLRPDPKVYYAYFPRPAGKQCGEWTPRYMFDEWTPPLLARLAPAARLLVLVRDPIERMVSALTYIGEKQRSASGGSGPPGDAIINREFIRSLYWYQLRNVLEHFPREQLLVLQYERCVRDTRKEAERTFQFLGLDPARLPLTTEHTRPRNATRVPKITVDHELGEESRETLRSQLRALAGHFPEIDLSLWPAARL
jgi:hypothetical protein